MFSPWEDCLLERKVESDLKDLLKTIVAFSNSVMPDHTAVILIGEKDDGTIQGVTNPDNIQKKIRSICDNIYPPILWKTHVYEKDSKQCIRLEIEYSNNTPHFGGNAWVRKGSETILANEELFQQLINIRSDVIRELSKWIDKPISVIGDPSTVPPTRKAQHSFEYTKIFSHRWPASIVEVIIKTINQWWVTFEILNSGVKKSEPLIKLTLTYDDERNRLLIIIAY